MASDATPRCASMASADRQMIGDATLAAARGPWRLAAGPLPRPRGAPCRRPLPHEGRRDRGRRS
ncbi:hypothetical protein D8B29_18610 [Verminephrobacter eiseniae]|nr:hypothetical protein [Verminephrobacter eiseniae]